MKKIYLLVTLTFTAFGLTQAQSIITIPGDTSVHSGTVTDEFDPMDIHLEVKNNTAQAQTFTWKLTNYSTPSAVWEVKLCDNNNCYDMLLNPGPYESFPVLAGDTMDFKFQFSPHCINGTGEADVLVYVTGDSANTARSIHFTGNITTTCMNAIGDVQKKNITLFPNPVKGTFVVKGIESAGNLSFEVYDLQGQLVKSRVVSASDEQIEISVETLSTGTYVLRVANETGKVVATSRLNKVN